MPQAEIDFEELKDLVKKLQKPKDDASDEIKAEFEHALVQFEEAVLSALRAENTNSLENLISIINGSHNKNSKTILFDIIDTLSTEERLKFDEKMLEIAVSGIPDNMPFRLNSKVDYLWYQRQLESCLSQTDIDQYKQFVMQGKSEETLGFAIKLLQENPTLNKILIKIKEKLEAKGSTLTSRDFLGFTVFHINSIVIKHESKEFNEQDKKLADTIHKLRAQAKSEKDPKKAEELKRLADGVADEKLVLSNENKAIAEKANELQKKLVCKTSSVYETLSSNGLVSKVDDETLLVYKYNEYCFEILNKQLSHHKGKEHKDKDTLAKIELLEFLIKKLHDNKKGPFRLPDAIASSKTELSSSSSALSSIPLLVLSKEALSSTQRFKKLFCSQKTLDALASMDDFDTYKAKQRGSPKLR